MIRFWLGVALGALLVIALVAFARGRYHPRGAVVGALGRVPHVSVVA